MTFDNEKQEEDISAVGAGSVGLFVLIVVMFIVAFAFIMYSIPGVSGWEEQLEACRIRGITTDDCPDDESYVGVPYNLPNNYFSTNSGRTSYTKWVWVYTETTYYSPSEKICYNSYSRRIQYFAGDRKEVTDFKDVVKNECAKPYQHTINLVFD